MTSLPDFNLSQLPISYVDSWVYFVIPPFAKRCGKEKRDPVDFYIDP